MTEPTTTPTTEPEEVTAGWLFMTANALGLSDADLSYILDVRPDTIRKSWRYGTQPIPDGVRDDMLKFIRFTDETVEVLVARAEITEDPAVITYPNLRDVPDEHLAATYGITWWDHVVFSARKAVGPDLYVGNLMEVAAAYEYLPGNLQAVHDDPSIIAIYATPAVPRTRANRLA